MVVFILKILASFAKQAGDRREVALFEAAGAGSLPVGARPKGRAENSSEARQLPEGT
jgi:hypothetical protein